MNTTNGYINQFKPLIYNDKSNKYIVSWGLENIGGNNYKWNYEIFNKHIFNGFIIRIFIIFCHKDKRHYT